MMNAIHMVLSVSILATHQRQHYHRINQENAGQETAPLAAVPALMSDFCLLLLACQFLQHLDLLLHPYNLGLLPNQN
jgi:hypothetical protein